MTEVRFPVGEGNFSLRHRVQTGSRNHPASCSTSTGGSFSWDKPDGACNWPLTSI